MTGQALLFVELAPEPPEPEFDGETATPEDAPRLSGQLAVVLEAIQGEKWWTLDELQAFVETRLGRRVTQTSVSARLRDLRKEKFGGHTVERRNEGGGLFRYRLGRGVSDAV